MKIKNIIIWLIGVIAIVLILMQLFYIVYLAQTYKATFFQHKPVTFDFKYLFLTKNHVKLLWIALGSFTAIVLFQSLRPIFAMSRNKFSEDGDKINYTSLSSLKERKKGLVRIEFDKKGNITTNTIRWKFDRIFQKLKIRYNKILKHFKIDTKYHLNTFQENVHPVDNVMQYHSGGIPLIVERKYFNLFGHYSRYYLSSGNIHSLFIGSTGRGKSVTFVIAMLYFYALAGENVMLNDPKGELYDATREFFLERGYNVIVLDFQNTRNSSVWNPLQLAKEIYQKEITSYLFYLKIENRKVEEDSEYFFLDKDDVIDFLGEDVTIHKINNQKELNIEINSRYFENDTIGLYVSEVQHWSKNKVIQLPGRKIADSNVFNGKMKFKVNEIYENGTGNISEAIEILRDIAHAITFEAATNQPFWNSGAADMIVGGALLLLEQGEVATLNFKSIRLLFDNEMLLNHYIQKNTTIESYSRKYLSQYLKATGNTKSSLISVFNNKMSLLDANENIAKITSNESDFKIQDVGFEKTAIFIIVHDEKKTYHPLVSMFTKQLYETLVNEIRKRKLETLPIPFNLLLDEFGVMPPLKDVDAILAAARSRSIRFNAFIQTFEQLEENYGRAIAKVIEDNCTNVIYLSSKTEAAAEYFEKTAGKKLVKLKNGYKVVPVITKERLMQFPRGKSLITSIERKPYISKLPPVYDYPIYKKGKVYRDDIEHKEVPIFNLAEELKKEIAYAYELSKEKSNENVWVKNEGI